MKEETYKALIVAWMIAVTIAMGIMIRLLIDIQGKL
jgi:hypothetical protein